MILPEVHANILLRAFPTNPAYGYDPTTGIPFAPPLPAPILAAVSAATNSIWANTQVNAVKSFIGATYNIYGNQYTYSGPYSSPTDSNGDPADVGALRQAEGVVGCPSPSGSDRPRCPTSTTLIAVTTSRGCRSGCRTGRRMKPGCVGVAASPCGSRTAQWNTGRPLDRVAKLAIWTSPFRPP